MPMSDIVATLLAESLKKLLGPATQGTMVFLRCLPSDVLPLLMADSRFVVEGWTIASVGATTDVSLRTITADTAVEWREDKKQAVMLLVDIATAGAGMDGIYSAAREIGETELFDCARDLARGKLSTGCRGFARKAIVRARRQARHHAISPWQELLYLCWGSCSQQSCGSALPGIGLWPIAFDNQPDDADLDLAARMVERLLPLRGSAQSVEARVAALKLPEEQANAGAQLIHFLREADRLPRLEALKRLESESSLWLNRLQPGIFAEQSLREIIWVPWRSRTRLASWSGLVEEEDRPVLRLNPDTDNPKTRARLEVRWEVRPETLAKGSVEYVVEIRAGQDVLAERTVAHTGRSPQKCVFVQEDFGELDENTRFDAKIVIRALSHEVAKCESEDFLVFFGEQIDKGAKNSSGQVFNSLALAAIQVAPDIETWDRFVSEPHNGKIFQRDKKGYISCRGSKRAARVFSPPLLDRLAADWSARQGQPGRWRLVVRVDGSAAAEPEFIPAFINSAGERYTRASRIFAEKLAGSQGPLGILYGDVVWIADYVNAAIAYWEEAPPTAALVHTLEVVDLGQESLGAIVLPTHPLRVAWQQGFDLLAMWHCYEEKIAPAKVAKQLSTISSAHLPAFLPGFTDSETLVFADSLGFHAAAMVRADDPEPKATVALFARLLGGEDNVAPTVGRGAAGLLSEEIGRYLVLHPEIRRVRIHALRAGDGLTVARAMGMALDKIETGASEEDAAEETENAGTSFFNPLAFSLDFHNAGSRPEWSGRFLSATAEKRRSGAGGVPEKDRWMLESVPRPGGVSLPRLQWARRREPHPTEEAAHLALVFDVFPSQAEVRPIPALKDKGSLEVHGLNLSPVREFSASESPIWKVYIPPNFEGEKHPAGRSLTERLIRAHTAIQRAVTRHLGGSDEGDWPVLLTKVSPDLADLFEDLHRLCDWVITADRNAGVEYFDSPLALPGVYDAYLIDCVPERDDLGFLQLITSTACLDEVVRLFDLALGEMGLSASPRNCRFLLDALKSVSGRLALRLTGAGTVVQEMIALALVQGQCEKAAGEDAVWPSLAEGFFVPLDDVPELLRTEERGEGEERRADLLYVTVPKRGGLRLAFYEIKFRRSLRTARAADICATAEHQLNASCRRWDQLYGPDCNALERTLRYAYLARILRFYAKKARRHHLSEDAYLRISREIERMLCDGSVYILPLLSDFENVHKAFIFCPEYGGLRADRIAHSGRAEIWLFGPELLPEPGASRSDSTEIKHSKPLVLQSAGFPSQTAPPASNEAFHVGGFLPGRADIDLGIAKPGGDAVLWSVSIQANPHLLIVGLPGMGKTTCLIRLCQQLVAQGITPIVFSYHQDIDEKLTATLPVGMTTVNYAGLGFNPMEVSSESPLAHVDTVGMLRDIFSAIFPDLGDIQLGRLRDALKRSYQDRGWAPGCRGEIPGFGDFLSLLRADQKPDKGLLTRLAELDDYSFFDAGAGHSSLLDSTIPALVQIHTTQNEVLQRAFATFVLYNLYQSMFKRGTQNGITHAIIFDEAHRAAKLKLIPTMAKESRKFGISLILASQEVKDFDQSLYTAVASYLTLRLHETDAKLMAKMFSSSDKVALLADRIKQMAKYHGYFYGEGLRAPVMVGLGA